MQVLNFKIGIDFGADGNLKEFSPVGFSAAADAISTWSEAAVAELTFRLPPLRHDVQFTIEVFPYLADGLISQQALLGFFERLVCELSLGQSTRRVDFYGHARPLDPGRQSHVVCPAQRNRTEGFESRG